MNKKIHLFYGLLLGLILAFVGIYLFVTLFMKTDFENGIAVVKIQSNFGKLITIGAIPNLVAFFILLKMKREMWARGVVLATFILAISTIFYL